MSTPEPACVKLLFGGPLGAGKTTAIRALADAPPLSTEVPQSDPAAVGKPGTTVAFDFGTLRIDAHTMLHLYGLPGQAHLGFMAGVLADAALGAVIVVDATTPTHAADCVHWIATLRRIEPALRIAVAVSKTDLAPLFSLDAVRRAVVDAGVAPAPAMAIDPRDARQCLQLIRAMLLD